MSNASRRRAIEYLLVSLPGMLLLAGIVLPLIWPRLRESTRRDELTIAAVGPHSGLQQGHWEEMRRGITLFLERANREQMIPRTTIRLIERDDVNQARLATKVAAELVDHPDDVLLVLGHYSDDAALAAGEVYRKYGLPAITASSMAYQVTHNNAWYFRVLPNSAFEGRFIVNYIQHVLNGPSISIVYDNDLYGTSLLEGVRNAALAAGLTVTKQWKIDRENENFQEHLKTIITELRALKEPGAVFLATHEAESANIIKAINNPATAYTILGATSFATKDFIEQFRDSLQEQVQPGYYSDRVYAITPYLQDIAPEESREFRQAYLRTYRTEPSWIAAAYYDAAHLAVEAMRLAEIDVDDTALNKRRKIRDALAGLAEPEVAISGVTNQLYFTSEGDVEYAPYVGRYTQQQLLPAYSQYQLIRDTSTQVSSLQQMLAGSSSAQQLVALGNGNLLKEAQIVNTGIDINRISNIDMRHARYFLDFYLWFRFRSDFGDFDDTAITFSNAVAPITLDPPVFKETSNGETVRTYHVKGEFTHPVDVAVYPFEQPTLRITFYHNTRPVGNLRYVPDVVGMQGAANLAHISVDPVSGWKLNNIVSYQRIYDSSAPTSGTAGTSEATSKRVSSQFITDLRLIRNGLNFSVKTLYPLAVVIVCLYLVYFIPTDLRGTRLALSFALFLITFGYQYHLRQRFGFAVNYVMSIEVVMFVVYGLAVMAGIFTVLNYRLDTRRRTRTARFSKTSGRLIHLMIVAVLILWLMYAVAQKNGGPGASWLEMFADSGP